jgi:hypothetical protein
MPWSGVTSSRSRSGLGDESGVASTTFSFGRRSGSVCASVKFVESIVDDAVRDLRAGFRVYWPSIGENEMAEAHPLGALGRAFGRAGFRVFHEVSCRRHKSIGHIDLVAISTRRSLCVAVEGKRLYSGTGASSMFADWRRLGRTRLAHKWGFPRVDRHVRMLVTTSWQENIREWWMGSARVPKRRRHPAWAKLRKELEACLHDGRHIQSHEDWGEQWLLFAIGERATPFFPRDRG